MKRALHSIASFLVLLILSQALIHAITQSSVITLPLAVALSFYITYRFVWKRSGAPRKL